MNTVELESFDDGLRVILFLTKDKKHELGFGMYKQGKAVKVWERKTVAGNITARNADMPTEWLERKSAEKVLFMKDGDFEPMKTPLGNMFTLYKADFEKLREFLNERSGKAA